MGVEPPERPTVMGVGEERAELWIEEAREWKREGIGDMMREP
jgi:hypothetical protein